MPGYDSRIPVAYLSLGYDLFPFQAFDDAGQLIIPGSVSYPSWVKENIGRLASAPIWEPIYKTLSVLDSSQWDAFAAGVGFGSNDLRVSVFKSLRSVPNADAAYEWGRSYLGTITPTLAQYAGTHRVIDPAILKAISEALDMLPGNQKQNDPKTDPGGKRPGGGDPISLSLGEDAPVSETDAASAMSGFVPWLLLGLRFLTSLATNVALKNAVLTTVWWYPPQGMTIDKSFVEGWKPIHTTYDRGRNRVVHGIWDPSGMPKIWWGTEVKWGGWFGGMPHEPWQWCRAFYPTLNCGGPTIMADDRPLSVAGATRD
jgi:hypothetical protein